MAEEGSRRALRWDRARAEERARRLRRRLAAVTVVMVLVSSALTVWSRRNATSDGDLAGRDDTLVDGDVAVEPPPLAYEITYRITDLAGDDPIVTTETVTVRRPFESSVIATAADSGQVITTAASSFGSLAVTQTDGTPGVVFSVSPGAPSGDLVTRPTLAAATDAGLVTPGPVRQIAGRRCQEYRTGTTIQSGRLRHPDDGDAGEWSDFCVDGSGLVLEEVWVLGGTPARHRIATEVRALDPDDLDDGQFQPDGHTEVGAAGGGGTISPSVAGLAGSFWRDHPPEEPGDLGVEGFLPVGRFVVLPAGFGSSGGTDLADLTITTVWTWADDHGAFIAVELIEGRSAPPIDGVPVELGDGPATLEINLRHSLADREVSDGRRIRVRGTVDPDTVLGVLARLTAVTDEAGTLRLAPVTDAGDAVTLSPPLVSETAPGAEQPAATAAADGTDSDHRDEEGT